MSRRAASAVALAATIAVPAAAADLLSEDAAWGPLASRSADVTGFEQRPAVERVAGIVVRGLAIGGTADRLAGDDVVHRREGGVADGQASVAMVDDHHNEVFSIAGERGLSTGATCDRRALYVRGGSDPLAARAGRGLVALGAEALGDMGGGVFGARAESGWSDERGFLWHLEAAIAFPLPVHVIAEGDDDRRTFRTGLCLRWPGGAIARTPDEDPWMADIAVDYVATHDRVADRTTGGGLAEVTVAWRFANHWYVAAQAAGATNARGVDGSTRAVATAAGGLGATW